MKTMTFTWKHGALPVIDAISGERIGAHAAPFIRTDNPSQAFLAVFCSDEPDASVRLVSFSDVLYMNEAMAIAVQLEQSKPRFLHAPYEGYEQVIDKRAFSQNGTPCGVVVKAEIDGRSSSITSLSLDNEGQMTDVAALDIVSLNESGVMIRRDEPKLQYSKDSAAAAMDAAGQKSGKDAVKAENLPDMLSSIRSSLDAITKLFGDDNGDLQLPMDKANAGGRSAAASAAEKPDLSSMSLDLPELQNAYRDTYESQFYYVTGSSAGAAAPVQQSAPQKVQQEAPEAPNLFDARDDKLSERLSNIESLLGKMAEKDDKKESAVPGASFFAGDGVSAEPKFTPGELDMMGEVPMQQPASVTPPARRGMQSKSKFWRKNGIMLTALFLYSLACYLLSALKFM